MTLDDLFGETSCQPLADQTQSKSKVSQTPFPLIIQEILTRSGQK